MSSRPLTRATLIACVRSALEPQPWAHTLWEGGSSAFGRTDAFSDADLQVVVDDDKVLAAFACVEDALPSVASVESRLIVPEPTWHGHSQRFYRFVDAPEWLLLDLCVVKLSAPYKFNDEVHGRPPVLFDRAGVFASVRPIDRGALDSRLRERLEQIAARLHFFGHFPAKELQRGRAIDAAHWYHSLVLTSLVELLRIKHDPLRHNWGNRYLRETLPLADAARLAPLFYVDSPEALPARVAAVQAWAQELLAELRARPQLAG